MVKLLVSADLPVSTQLAPNVVVIPFIVSAPDVVAEFDIKPELWFFECHFPGNPIMPGCLGLDGLWQLTGFNLGWRGMLGKGMALGVGEVKLTGMVTPARKMLTYNVEFTRVIDRKLKIGVANGTVHADGELIYAVKDMKVGLASQEG